MNVGIEKLIDHLNEITQINQDMQIPEQYTLIIKLSDQITKKIISFISQIRVVDPNHLYYSGENLHITLYGYIPSTTDLNRLETFLKEKLEGSNLTFNLSGVATSAIIAEPVNFSLTAFRDHLNNHLGMQNFSNCAFEMKYYSWITTLRFRQEPSSRLLEFFNKNRTTDFGQLVGEYAYLYKTSNRLLDLTKGEILKIKL